MIRVLIVDDHMITRTGIRFFIEEDPDIKVIAEAGDGDEGIALCASLNPDVVLMDLDMPKLTGIEAVKSIISATPQARIIVLTGSASKGEVENSLSAGAKGYCLKDISYANLIGAIKSVVSGEIWIDSSISNVLLELANIRTHHKDKLKSNPYQLSDRELQTLALVVEGKTNQEIASKLGLSVDTAKSHLKRIMEKLAVSDRTQAAVKAVREDLI